MSKRKYTDEQYEDSIASSFSFFAAYKKLSGSNSGSGLMHFKRTAIAMGLDTSHFDRAKALEVSPKTKDGRYRKLPWQEVLVYNRNDGRREKTTILRRSMIESGISYQCENSPDHLNWMGQELTLEIDHIDGDNVNNCRENLRFLCPNCHSLYPNTPSWGEKQIGQLGRIPRKVYGPAVPRRTCEDCEAHISRGGTRCTSCAGARRPSKIDWPSNEELALLVWEKPMRDLAEDLKVSDVAIKKRCKKFNIQTPPRGHWLKSGK